MTSLKKLLVENSRQYDVFNIFKMYNFDNLRQYLFMQRANGKSSAHAWNISFDKCIILVHNMVINDTV